MGVRRRAAAPLVLFPLAQACGISVRQGGTAASSGTPEPEAPRIDVDAALAAVRAGRAVLVDVRSSESFQQKRAAGAVLLPLDEIEKSPREALAKLPPARQAIFYCT